MPRDFSPLEDLTPLAETWGELEKLSPELQKEDARRYWRRLELNGDRTDEKHPDSVDKLGL